MRAGRNLRFLVPWVLSSIALSSCAKQPGTTACSDVTGHYEAVTESEWLLELTLGRDQSAEIVSASWEAGKFDDRSEYRYRGVWTMDGDRVLLDFDERTETLQFSGAMSFEDFGQQGSGPGLRGVRSSSSRALFVGQNLWCSAALNTIRWP